MGRGTGNYFHLAQLVMTLKGLDQIPVIPIQIGMTQSEKTLVIKMGHVIEYGRSRAHNLPCGQFNQVFKPVTVSVL